MKDNIAVLNDTLSILKKGYYTKNGLRINLKLSKEQMRESMVLLPERIDEIRAAKLPVCYNLGRCGYGCYNRDSFSYARELDENKSYFSNKGDRQEILVLNLANPVHPGGGVRRGAVAQEEDLCRKSSLLLSLEDGKASLYYNYNRSLGTYMGSDGIIITPHVEILKDENGELLDDSVIVAVMTCAAPMIRYGLEGLTQQEYEALLYHRIEGMMKCAAYYGYKLLVLGAFGCGAFGRPNTA